jgi:DNA modification methylase
VKILNTRTTHVDPAKLVLHGANPRKGDIRAVVESFRANGFWGSVVVDERNEQVLAGNHRVMAARELGWDEIPVTYVKPDSDEHALRILLADNRTSDLGTYDNDALAQLLDHLASTDAGLAGTGYDQAALDGLLEELGHGRQEEPKDDPGAEVDRAEELRQKWGTERGQLWQIGRHRLLCGDATSAEDVARLLDGERAHLAFTSPPYNVGANGKGGGADLRERKYLGDDDDRTDDDFAALLNGATDVLLDHADTAMVNIQLLGANKRVVAQYVADRADVLKDVLHWVKPSAAPHIQPGVMGSRVEWIIALSASNPSKAFPRSPIPRGNLWNVVECHGAGGVNEYSDVHAATFPGALAAHVVTHFSQPGDRVLDTFNGTGTTIAECERAGRTGYGVEIDPRYVAVALERLAKMGLTPELTGATPATHARAEAA